MRLWEWAFAAFLALDIILLLVALDAGSRIGVALCVLPFATIIASLVYCSVTTIRDKRRCHALQQELDHLESELIEIRDDILRALSNDNSHPLAEQMKLIAAEYSSSYTLCDSYLEQGLLKEGMREYANVYAVQRRTRAEISSILVTALDAKKRMHWDEVAERRRSRQKRNENRERWQKAAAALNLREKEVRICEAVRDGSLDVQPRGSGLTYITLVLDSCTDRPMKVTIPKGTIFVPAHSSTQNMIAVSEREINVLPYAVVSESIRSACINMCREVPTGTDEFSIQERDGDDDLGRLLQTEAFSNCADAILQQFAVWTISDNPAFTDMTPIVTAVRTGSRATNRTKTACTHQHRRAIRDMFEQAGIETRKYRLFATG